MNIKTIILLFIFSTETSKADMFGADILILSEIATSTAKELGATLELLEISHKSAKEIKEANRQISTKMETMERVDRLTKRAERLSKAKVRSNAELNSELRKIKFSIAESKRLQNRFEKNYGSTFEAKEQINNSIEMPEVDKKTIDRRLSISESTSSQAGHTQNTAMNTAITNQILHEQSYNQNLLMREQLEFFNEQRERNQALDKKMNNERKFLGVE